LKRAGAISAREKLVEMQQSGECWIKSCCDWDDRQDGDICSLDYRRRSIADKMKRIYTETSLNTEFFQF